MLSGNYEIFREVSKQGSFTNAAASLHLTRSAVSHSVSTLEDKRGFPLFIREKNRVILTEEGGEMLPFVEELLQQEA